MTVAAETSQFSSSYNSYIDSVINTLSKEYDDLKSKSKEKYQSPQIISGIYLLQLPSPLLNQVFFYYYSGKMFNLGHQRFYPRAMSILEDSLNFITATKKKSIKIKFDAKGLIQFLDGKSNELQISYFFKSHDRIRPFVSPLFTQCTTVNIKMFMNQLLKQVSNLVKTDYVQPNAFEQFFAIHVKETPELFSEIQKTLGFYTTGDMTTFSKCCEFLGRHFSASNPNDHLVLKYALLRYISDINYLADPSILLSNTHRMKFLKKCLYISCFKPHNLGINEKLFTNEQLNLSINVLVREVNEVHEISNLFRSLEFYVCPIDMFYVLSKIIQKIDTFVKTNQIKRKFGQFSSMVEDESMKIKRNEMLSFDDCFSLFFSILAADPPLNAVAISAWFEQLPRLPIDTQLNIAKMTFSSSIQHILSFSGELIDKKDIDENDPLGVT